MISIIKSNGFGQPSENLLSIPQQALLHFEVALEYDHEILDSRTQQIWIKEWDSYHKNLTDASIVKD